MHIILKSAADWSKQKSTIVKYAEIEHVHSRRILRSYCLKKVRSSVGKVRSYAACSTIVFRGSTPRTLPCNPIERGTLEGNAACMKAAYDRNAGCMQPALRPSVPPALVHHLKVKSTSPAAVVTPGRIVV